MSTTPQQCAICGTHLAIPNFQPPPQQFSVGSDLLPANSTASTKEIIAKLLIDAQQLEDRIVRIETFLQTLREQQDVLETEISLHKALVAPISRMPPEILADIFTCCVEARWLDIPPTIARRSDIRLDKSPCRLSSICRRWRTIAHSTPKLWTCIALVLRPKHLKLDVVFVTAWLARSGGSPLSICLESDGAFKSDLHSLMEIFSSCAHRWQNIRMCLPAAATNRLSSVKGRLGILQWLFIVTQSEPSPLNTFSTAPNLRHLFYDEIVWPTSFIVSWSQLRSCVVARPCSAQTYFDILSLASNVDSFSLDFTSVDHNYSRRSIHLQSLRYLRFRADPTLNAAILFDVLDLPSLEHLQYTNLRPENTPCPYLPALLSRCSLKSLTFQAADTLYVAPDGRNDMLEILQQTPQLLELIVVYGGAYALSPEFLEYFFRGDVVPHLERLEMHIEPFQRGFDMLRFIEGLNLRISANSPSLKRVHLTLIVLEETREFAEVMARLSQLVKEKPSLSLRVSRMGRDQDLIIS